MSDVVMSVKSRGLNHRACKAFLDKIENGNDDGTMYLQRSLLV